MSLWIPGKPVPAARARARRGGPGYYPAEYDAWLQAARIEVHNQRPEQITGPVSVLAVVHSDGIQVIVGSAENLRCRRPRNLHGDLDNFGKALIDALQSIRGRGGAYRNDSQIVDLHLFFDPDPGDPHARR